MPEIRYSFKTFGADNVRRQFDSIASAARAAAQAQKTTAPKTSGRNSPEAIANREAKAAERAGKAQERASQAAAKAADRAAQSKLRAAEKVANAEEKAQEKATKAYEKAGKDRVRAEERKARAIVRANKAHEREIAKAAREHAAKDRWKPQSSRLGAVLRGETSGKRYAGSIASSIGATVGSGALNAIISATLAPYLISGAVAGAGVRQRMENEDKALGLAKSGRLAGQATIDHRQLLREAERTALDVKGTQTSDILDAQQKYVSMTGDMAGARKNAKTWAIAARATNSNESDIASTMATMRDKFGITDEKEMQDALANLVFQGKSGAFELSDASRYFTEMGAAGSRFGLDKGAGGIKTLGGLAQIARMSTGSGAEASTGVQAMLRQLVAQSDNIKKSTGASVFADSTKTKTRDVQDVLVDVISGAKGDLTKLQKIFGEEGIKGVSKMITTYNDAQNALGPKASAKDRKEAGSEALRKMFSDAIEAGGDWSEVMKDAAQQAQSSTDALATAWESVMTKVGERMAPAIDVLVKNMDLLGPAVEPAVSIFADLVESAGGFIAFLRRHGLIQGAEEKKGPTSMGEAVTEQAKMSSQLSQLDEIEKKYGGLTPEQRAKRNELKGKKLELDQWIGEHNSTAGEKGDKAVTESLLANKPGNPLTAALQNFGKSPLEQESQLDALVNSRSGDAGLGDLSNYEKSLSDSTGDGPFKNYEMVSREAGLAGKLTVGTGAMMSDVVRETVKSDSIDKMLPGSAVPQKIDTKQLDDSAKQLSSSAKEMSAAAKTVAAAKPQTQPGWPVVAR